MNKFSSFILTISTAFTVLICSACSSHRNNNVSAVTDKTESLPQISPGNVRQMPHAVIYKTNGDWNDKVAVGLSKDHATLTYFPDPYDVSVETEPLVLVDGWLLDRQGNISENTAFLKWTMSEYHTFERVPSVEQIMASIIPGAKVTDIHMLPMTSMAAQSDTAAVNNMIRSGHFSY